MEPLVILAGDFQTSHHQRRHDPEVEEGPYNNQANSVGPLRMQPFDNDRPIAEAADA